MQCIHPNCPTPPNARPGVAMTRGKSLYAVRHTSHMSCGQIGDPQEGRFLPLLVIDSLHIESGPIATPYRLGRV